MDTKVFHIISITVVAVLLLQLISTVNSESIKYGEVCWSPNNQSENNYHAQSPENEEYDIDSDYCDFGNGVCTNNKCLCEFPHILVYNDRLCQCGSPMGSYCSDMIPCLSGNHCENNICICPSPSKPLPDGGCTGGIYSVCKHDSHCTSDLFLSCLEGSCSCKNTRSTVFEQDLNLSEGCKIRADEQCSPGCQPCVSNSKCIHQYVGQKFACRCDKGYLPTSSGICKKDYEQPCLPGFRECNDNRGLICINDTCRCIDSDTFYDELTRSCVTYVGKPCGNIESEFGDNYNIGCLQNAECSFDPTSSVIHSSRKICNCQFGFGPEREGGKTCVPVHLKEVL